MMSYDRKGVDKVCINQFYQLPSGGSGWERVWGSG